MFLGGTLIAWAPLLYTFLDDGVFKDQCVYINITEVTIRAYYYLLPPANEVWGKVIFS